MRRVTPFFAWLLAVATQLVSVQDRTADKGVYTSAQAARGARVFDTHCVSCHRESGTAPVLAGERFSKAFADSTLLAVFTTIQTTMPRQSPGSLTEMEYLDTLAHLLTLNGYPDGMTELAVVELSDIKVPGQPTRSARVRRSRPQTRKRLNWIERPLANARSACSRSTEPHLDGSGRKSRPKAS